MLLPWLLFQQVVCYHWIPSTCEVPVKYLWLSSRFFFASSSDGASTTGNTAFQDKGFDPTGWELALVTAPSNTTSSASVGQLVCFFNHRIIFSDVFMFPLHVQMLWHLIMSKLLYSHISDIIRTCGTWAETNIFFHIWFLFGSFSSLTNQQGDKDGMQRSW